MIIKDITIRNFRSYYGESKIEFSTGLTLIVGDNGDGKTTLFEALSWLFNTSTAENSLSHFSEMRKSQMELGEVERVSVAMSFEHNGEKYVEKSFSIEKTNEDRFRTGRLEFIGYECHGSERIPVDGNVLMNRCFDAFIQRYSMFKGESDLDVFKKPEAFKELVDKFSDLKKFKDFVKLADDFANRANTAFIKESKNDKNIEKQATILDNELQAINRNLGNINDEIKKLEKAANSFDKKINDLEKHQETSEKYQEIKKRLTSKEDDRSRIGGKIAVTNYNYNLLDKLWSLCAFPPVLREFQEKSSAFSKEKRKQNEQFIKEQAKNQGKIEAIKELQTLANGSTSLPWYLPDQQTMEEMLKDHICKVCNRPAPEGSEAYEFMKHKLDEYKRHVQEEAKAKEIEKLEEQVLFKNEFIEELHNLSIGLSGSTAKAISDIKTEIQDKIALNERLKNDLASIEKEIEEIESEKARLLIQADGITADLLEKEFKDIKGYYNEKGKAEKRIVELNIQKNNLEVEKANKKTALAKLNPEGSQAKTYKKVNDTLELISQAFQKAKETNLSNFLVDLEDKANTYLKKLSVSDFHGMVRLVPTSNDSADIKLYSSNGSLVVNPSGSQLVTLYMSVLFAISDLTTLKREENYPLIFDAATYAFADAKQEVFYNIIDKLDRQCIIVTKDFINKGRLKTDDIDKLTCSVYRIQKAEGFDQSDLSTIRTNISLIK